MEILIIIALILINGIFSLSEMSLVSSRRFKLESARKRGHKGARTALNLTENPTRFLSTVQIGITLIGILLGVYSGEKLTADLEGLLMNIELIAKYAHSIAVILIVVSVTYVSIVLGELLPKRIGMTFPEPIAIALARPMHLLSIITSPFVWLLTATNNLLLRMMGIRKPSVDNVSEEEIKSIVRESAEGGEIRDIEHHIVERVFELGDRSVSSLITHRSQLVFFDVADSWETIRSKVNEEKHSAYPVCADNNLDEIIGIVQLKDLFVSAAHDFNITDYTKKPIYLNENSTAYHTLELFKKARMHYGIVFDEYGSMIGIVTMDDLLDALVGDVSESDHEENAIVQRDDGSWLVDGQYSVIEFLKYFDLEAKRDVSHKYATVAGMLIFQHHTLPEVGDRFSIGDYDLEVIDKDGQRIDKILVTKKSE